MGLTPPFADPYVGGRNVLPAIAEHVRRERAAERVCLVNIHGRLGSGVTCTSTQLHRVYERELGEFVWLVGELPDERVTPRGELFRQLLRGLGVRDVDQTAGEAELAESCRRVLTNLTRDRPYFVVVDDFRQFEQIEPLVGLALPNLVIVVNTTEEQRELGMYHCRFFKPELLSEADARYLFRDILGETASEVADATVDRIVAHCGGIPHAVRLLAAQLIGRPELAGPLLEELEADALGALSLDPRRCLERSAAFSYNRLDDGLREVCRRLSALPFADFGVPVATAALGGRPGLARAVADLAGRNLLDRVGDRYAFDPLVRRYVRNRPPAKDSGREDVRRGIDWYLTEALPRARAMSGRWWAGAVTAELRRRYDGPGFTRADAEAWFEAELANLVIAVREAPRHGMGQAAWLLCVCLFNHLHVHQRHDAWIDTHLVGLEAARAAGDEEGVMQIGAQLGSAYLAAGDTKAAREHFAESLAVARRLGHALGEQSTVEWLGKVAAAERRYVEALDYFAQSLAVIEKVTDPEQRRRATATVRLQQGRVLLALERWAEALECGREGVEIFGDLPNELNNRAKCREVVGTALSGAGDPAAALPVLVEMLELLRRDKAARPIAHGCVVLGDAYAAAGRVAEAIACYREALEFYERVGDPLADAVRARLDRLS